MKVRTVEIEDYKTKKKEVKELTPEQHQELDEQIFRRALPLKTRILKEREL